MVDDEASLASGRLILSWLQQCGSNYGVIGMRTRLNHERDEEDGMMIVQDRSRPPLAVTPMGLKMGPRDDHWQAVINKLQERAATLETLTG